MAGVAGNATGATAAGPTIWAMTKKQPDLDQRCTSKTRKGKPCRNRPLPGLKKCAVHSSSAKAKSSAARGQVAPAHRPDTITEDRIVHMETLLKSGSYISVACQVAEIPYSTHKEWVEKGTRPAAGPEFGQYRAYAQRIEKALAIGEDNLVKVIAAGAVEDWRAAAWMLERKEPERWGKKSVNSEEVPADKPAGASETSMSDLLKEMRKSGKPAGKG